MHRSSWQISAWGSVDDDRAASAQGSSYRGFLSSDIVSVSSASASQRTDAVMDTSMNISPESTSREESDSDSDNEDNPGDTNGDHDADAEELRRLQVL
jgi:hypothetical protein